MTNSVVIVDAFSSGRLLPQLFSERGWSAIHLKSSSNVPAFYSSAYPGDDAFDAAFVLGDANDADILRKLKSKRPDALVCGSESGTTTHDRIARKLGLPGNNPDTNSWRTDKFAMQERLREVGLPHIRQRLITNAAEAEALANEQTGWPLVIKPVDSAGGDGVRFCDGPVDAHRAVAEMGGTKHAMGRKIDALVAQERLEGNEYVVNAVAYGGEIAICEIWQIDRTVNASGDAIYDCGFLLEPVGAPQEGLVAYVRDVAKALGIDHGAIHAEVMQTRAGPVLIEVAARLAGAISHRTTMLALSNSHAGRLVESICDPRAFATLCNGAPTRRAFAAFVSLINSQDGEVIAVPGMDRVSFFTFLR